MTITKYNRITGRDEKRTYKLSEALVALEQLECLSFQDAHHAFIRAIDQSTFLVTGNGSACQINHAGSALKMALQLAQGA
jgi:hypothetical protein